MYENYCTITDAFYQLWRLNISLVWVVACGSIFYTPKDILMLQMLHNCINIYKNNNIKLTHINFTLLWITDRMSYFKSSCERRVENEITIFWQDSWDNTYNYYRGNIFCNTYPINYNIINIPGTSLKIVSTCTKYWSIWQNIKGIQRNNIGITLHVIVWK